MVPASWCESCTYTELPHGPCWESAVKGSTAAEKPKSGNCCCCCCNAVQFNEQQLLHLQGLLPALRKQLRLPRLEYVSIVNQGDYMIEVPAERSDIPRASALR